MQNDNETNPVVPPDGRAFETNEMGGAEFLRRLAEIEAHGYYAFRVWYPSAGTYKMLCLSAKHTYRRADLEGPPTLPVRERKAD